MLRTPEESIANPFPTLTPPRTVEDAVGRVTVAIPVLLSIASPEPILIPPNTVAEATGRDSTLELRTPLEVMESPAQIITPPKVAPVATGNVYPLGAALICPFDGSIVILVPSTLTPPNTVVVA